MISTRNGRELAELFGVSQEWVYSRASTEGALPYYRPRKKYCRYVFEDDLVEHWLEHETTGEGRYSIEDPFVDADAVAEDTPVSPTQERTVYLRQMRRLIEIFCELMFTPRETEILWCRFGFYGTDMTLEEVGEMLGLSIDRIRCIEVKVLAKMRDYSSFWAEAAGRVDDD